MKKIILVYHQINEDDLFMSASLEQFIMQMEYLKSKKFKFCNLKELLHEQSGNNVCVMFDDCYSSIKPAVNYMKERQLKNEIGSPGAGNEWHHIVEQSQIAKSGFSPQIIQNTNNIMSISKTAHRAISGYYSSVQPFTNGMIVRNWLAGQSFSAQYEFGMNVIKMFM